MPRETLALETHGTITTTGYADKARKHVVQQGVGTKAVVWVARCRFRGAATGNRTKVFEASAPTKARAERTLKAKLTTPAQAKANGTLRSTMRVSAAAQVWLMSLDGTDRAEGTRSLYAGNVRRYIDGTDLGHLSLTEANNVGTIEAWLLRLATTHGNAAAKGARSVLSGTIGMAVRHDVLPHSAVKDVRLPRVRTESKTARDTDRALTLEESAHLLEVAETDDIARRHDLTDLLHFLDATGVRINEALGLRWEDVNLETGAVRIRGSKTELSDRPIHLPERVTERLRARLGRLEAQDDEAGVKLAGTGVVFHSPRTTNRDKPRDRTNVVKRLRSVYDAAGMPWATSHSHRHTVVTRVIEAGFDIGIAADLAGHADLRTTAQYVGRKRDTSALAKVL